MERTIVFAAIVGLKELNACITDGDLSCIELTILHIKCACQRPNLTDGKIWRGANQSKQANSVVRQKQCCEAFDVMRHRCADFTGGRRSGEKRTCIQEFMIANARFVVACHRESRSPVTKRLLVGCVTDIVSAAAIAAMHTPLLGSSEANASALVLQNRFGEGGRNEQQHLNPY